MTSDSSDHLLKTALYETHLEAGARMVPFGGWLMPVQYQGIMAEHLAVRAGAGLFDLSHMGRLEFHGPEGKALLQSITTNDISRLEHGRAQYGLLCNEQGAILDDTVSYSLGDHYLLVVNASNRVKVLEWIGRQRPGALDLVVDRTADTVMIGFQGPAAQDLLGPVTDVDLDSIRYYAAGNGRVLSVDALIARTGYTGEDGFELIVSADDGPGLWKRLSELGQDTHPVLAGLGARDTLRLEAGMPLYGHEIDEATNPYEAGLGRVVKLEKGEFVGRQALELLSKRVPERRLVGFQMVENAVPRQGYRLVRDGEDIGVVTSGTFSPSLKRNLGMAYVQTRLAEPGSEFSVVVREQPRRAVVSALPHYPHRTRRIPVPAKQK